MLTVIESEGASCFLSLSFFLSFPFSLSPSASPSLFLSLPFPLSLFLSLFLSPCLLPSLPLSLSPSLPGDRYVYGKPCVRVSLCVRRVVRPRPPRCIVGNHPALLGSPFSAVQSAHRLIMGPSAPLSQWAASSLPQESICDGRYPTMHRANGSTEPE